MKLYQLRLDQREIIISQTVDKKQLLLELCANEHNRDISIFLSVEQVDALASVLSSWVARKTMENSSKKGVDSA